MKFICLDTNLVGRGLLAAAAFSMVACATAQPPKELVDAREAYEKTEHGKAREFNPAALHDAKSALDKAEASFEDDPDSENTRDEAYVALRQAQRAEVEASTLSWQQRAEKAKSAATQAQAKAMERAQTDLVSARKQLESERAAREAAEAKTKDMLARLAAANAAAVKEEPRGTVITLAGGVLFASNKSQLLPGAQTSLGQIAAAIKEQDDKKVLIEGHTDSRGSDATNQALSKARADSVAAFLISNGVPQERVTTAGLGPSRPVADNNTPEGRANNRRVEIVIQNLEPK
jgi:outer membrane protein OmpA-like peptidoglycan-associated protein